MHTWACGGSGPPPLRGFCLCSEQWRQRGGRYYIRPPYGQDPRPYMSPWCSITGDSRSACASDMGHKTALCAESLALRHSQVFGQRGGFRRLVGECAWERKRRIVGQRGSGGGQWKQQWQEQTEPQNLVWLGGRRREQVWQSESDDRDLSGCHIRYCFLKHTCWRKDLCHSTFNNQDCFQESFLHCVLLWWRSFPRSTLQRCFCSERSSNWCWLFRSWQWWRPVLWGRLEWDSWYTCRESLVASQWPASS